MTDDDWGTIDIRETDGGSAVTEGGATDSYGLRLTAQPAEDVSIVLSAPADLSVSPTALTFTPTNWDTYQEVTVSAPADGLVEGTESHDITHSGTGLYEGVTATVTVTVFDSDSGGLLADPHNLSLTEGGPPGVYGIRLTACPSGTVTVSAGAGLEVDPTTLTFCPDDWDTAKEVGVRATDDAIYRGPRTALITHTASGDGYDGVAGAEVTVLIQDDDPIPV